MGLLGLLFHIFAVKLPAQKRRATAANMPFKPADYFAEDWMAICASVLSVVIVAMLIDELSNFSEYVMKYVKFFFVAVGYMGSSFLQSVLSKTDKAINKVVDIKTNIADGKSQ